MFSDKLKEKFKERLNGMISELEEEVSQTVEGMRDGGENFPDPSDRATLESDRNLTLRIRDRERKLRKKVEEAMERLDTGTFGICEICEEDIAVERLMARPVTTLCINCKEEQEQEEERHQK
ncbi:MAG: RNA polymerase-binding protein DksA [Deltaproteobacteria bacterium]|nr:RNA polymerase-binding protein DksA [Deltaproteobacteria bacterium]